MAKKKRKVLTVMTYLKLCVTKKEEEEENMRL